MRAIADVFQPTAEVLVVLQWAGVAFTPGTAGRGQPGFINELM